METIEATFRKRKEEKVPMIMRQMAKRFAVQCLNA
jgi:hypothetical protein